MAIVYLHKRKDTNDVFYIGVGKHKRRAYSKSGRNQHWHNIVNKVGYFVEIIEQDISIENALEKEKELVKYYGKTSNGGILVNVTDGGELYAHWSGTKFTPIHKYNISKGNMGKIHSTQTIEKLKKPKTEEHKKNISRGRIGMVFSEEHKINLSKSHIGQTNWNKGGNLSSDVKRKISKSLIGNSNAKTIKVFQYSLNGVLIKEWDKLSDIKNTFGFNLGNISQCICGKRKTSYGFIWKSQ